MHNKSWNYCSNRKKTQLQRPSAWPQSVHVLVSKALLESLAALESKDDLGWTALDSASSLEVLLGTRSRVRLDSLLQAAATCVCGDHGATLMLSFSNIQLQA